MPGVNGRNQELSGVHRRYGSETDLETIYGISRRTLQKHRFLGKGPRFYRFGRKVLYDLTEFEQYLRESDSEATS